MSMTSENPQSSLQCIVMVLSLVSTNPKYCFWSVVKASNGRGVTPTSIASVHEVGERRIGDALFILQFKPFCRLIAKLEKKMTTGRPLNGTQASYKYRMRRSR